jgi:hypothetical protein
VLKDLKLKYRGSVVGFLWSLVNPLAMVHHEKWKAGLSPFESIRSAEIAPLFERHFETVAMRDLGGTLQHLLYNGIIHNFAVDDEEACRYLKAVAAIEDALIDARALPSDFKLLVGRRRAVAQAG